MKNSKRVHILKQIYGRRFEKFSSAVRKKIPTNCRWMFDELMVMFFKNQENLTQDHNEKQVDDLVEIEILSDILRRTQVERDAYFDFAVSTIKQGLKLNRKKFTVIGLTLDRLREEHEVSLPSEAHYRRELMNQIKEFELKSQPSGA